MHKYNTEEERQTADKAAKLAYYYRNRDILKAKNAANAKKYYEAHKAERQQKSLERYHAKKAAVEVVV